MRKLADSASDWLFGEGCEELCPANCEDCRMSFKSFCDYFSLSEDKVRSWVLSLTVESVNQIGRNL